jgi:hypothetical protein
MSNAYSNNGRLTVLPAGSVNSPLQVASVTVPTGTYIVTVSVYAEDLTPTSTGFNTSLQCQVFQDGVYFDFAYSSFAYPNALLQLTLPTSASVTSATSTLSVACGTGSTLGHGIAAAQGRIQAIQVSSLSIQQ